MRLNKKFVQTRRPECDSIQFIKVISLLLHNLRILTETEGTSYWFTKWNKK